MRTDILGIEFDCLTMEEALDRAEALLETEGPSVIVTPNAEIVVQARRDGRLKGVINSADLVLPDGIGIVYGAGICGRDGLCRLPGIDFAEALLNKLQNSGRSLFLLGAKPGVGELAAEKLLEKYPGLLVCGVHDGYYSDGGKVAETIRASSADLVFVCLGSPKQEYYMDEYGAETGARLLIGLGGSLDVFAGAVKRAPPLMRRLGLEWLYRLIKQPSRFGRMLRLPKFLILALADKLKGG